MGKNKDCDNASIYDLNCFIFRGKTLGIILNHATNAFRPMKEICLDADILVES